MTGCKRGSSIPNRLAPTYPDSAVTRPFPFNGYYPEAQAPDIDEERYKLLVDGLVASKQPWTLEELYALPQETQVTRLICVEGWSAVGKWTGAPLREFLAAASVPTSAPSMCISCAPRAIRYRSTCRPRCMRRRR